MPEESANNKELRSRYFFPNAWKSYLILAIGILMTLYATYYTKRDIDMQTSDELRKVCSDIHTKITARLNSHALLLRSGASFFAASDSITRDNWHVIYRNNRLEKNLPRIQGLGFS